MGVRFLLDGAVVAVDDVDPTATLLNHLRYSLRRTGTKEGCAEGDCGACTVLVGDLAGTAAVAWRAVNACILFLPMLDGKAVQTVESLARAGQLNPLQTAMATNGSSQCGFCTPGFVMSLYGRCIGASGHALPVADVLAGNLCRCTGYGPILAAAEATGALPRDDADGVAGLLALADDEVAGGQHGDRRWFGPRTPEALALLLAEHPNARIVAGATDVGLWVTKGLQSIETPIFTGDIAALRTLDETPAGLRIGAAVRFAEAHAAFARLHHDLGELTRRFAGLQVRNQATVGGNIANGSPIGDIAPALIALGAELTLRSVDGPRTMRLEDYFIAYGQQDRRAHEFVESIWVPCPGPDDVILIAKLSRRFDSDISAVCGAFRLTVRDGQIDVARVAFGGMAGTPQRAAACEAVLTGAPFSEATIEVAAAALHGDYTPLDDVRGSSAYRREAAANLLRKLWAREAGEAVSVRDVEAVRG